MKSLVVIFHFSHTPYHINQQLLLALTSKYDKIWASLTLLITTTPPSSLPLTPATLLPVLNCVSRVRLSATVWTVALQAPVFTGILQARVLEGAAMPSCRGSSRLRDGTCALPSPAPAGSLPLVPPKESQLFSPFMPYS